MIQKLGTINFKEIKRISPSQFYSMKNCAYKSLLAEAFDKNPLLPISPYAYFGTVLHKILELIAKGVVKSEDELNAEFDKQVKILEDDLCKKGLEFFVPIKFKIRNFGLKKIQLKNHLHNGLLSSKISTNTKYHSEKWFESQDKSIVGIFDLVIENGNEIEIVDFKTGAIQQDYLDDEGDVYTDVKNEYKEQLKLYAYLYFESTKKFPTKLSLIDLAKFKFPVEFSESECKSLFEEAKNLLLSTNQSITSKSFQANPNEENCKNCLYRPACHFFHKTLENDFSFNDVSGKIKDIKVFRNGNMNMLLQYGDKMLTIKNLQLHEFEFLKDCIDKDIRIYNLRKELNEFTYSLTETSRIYE